MNFRILYIAFFALSVLVSQIDAENVAHDSPGFKNPEFSKQPKPGKSNKKDRFSVQWY